MPASMLYPSLSVNNHTILQSETAFWVVMSLSSDCYSSMNIYNILRRNLTFTRLCHRLFMLKTTWFPTKTRMWRDDHLHYTQIPQLVFKSRCNSAPLRYCRDPVTIYIALQYRFTEMCAENNPCRAAQKCQLPPWWIYSHRAAYINFKFRSNFRVEDHLHLVHIKRSHPFRRCLYNLTLTGY